MEALFFCNSETSVNFFCFEAGLQKASHIFLSGGFLKEITAAGFENEPRCFIGDGKGRWQLTVTSLGEGKKDLHSKIADSG